MERPDRPEAWRASYGGHGMSISPRIASVTNSASSNDSVTKPRLVELSEKRKPKSVEESRTAIVMI